MLREGQAKDVVVASLAKAVPGRGFSAKSVRLDETLGKLQLSGDQIRSLAITIASDAETGVPRLQHYLDPNQLMDLGEQTTIADLTNKVLKLSAGKLCSNPKNPHPQECCPYPEACPECGYPVR